MRVASVITVAAFGAMLLAGCSDKDVMGVNTNCSNLQGVFIAKTATIVSTSGTPTTRNLLADSSSFDITFATGTFSSSFRTGGTTSSASGNTTGATATSITIGQALFPNTAASNTFTCSLDDDQLTLESPASSFVFPGETESRPATLRLVLTRKTQ
jgi:hypothetical protein